MSGELHVIQDLTSIVLQPAKGRKAGNNLRIFFGPVVINDGDDEPLVPVKKPSTIKAKKDIPNVSSDKGKFYEFLDNTTTSSSSHC
ncbi:hypothetical protein CVT25_015705 [Psilocybe cyanescens]|uniref:Uncharacterized protein n=1 Tax=Psilocybe cyanescens TaxID=93625 RepID=A0A409XT95_PSICY|nr:hypothetical protein CVT25_015705 [Psilocybe cyanescens]